MSWTQREVVPRDWEGCKEEEKEGLVIDYGNTIRIKFKSYIA